MKFKRVAFVIFQPEKDFWCCHIAHLTSFAVVPLMSDYTCWPELLIVVDCHMSSSWGMAEKTPFTDVGLLSSIKRFIGK